MVLVCGEMFVVMLVVVVVAVVMEDEGRFKLLKPPPIGGDGALPLDVRAKKSCLACSADDMGLRGVGEGLYDNDGVEVAVGDDVAVVTDDGGCLACCCVVAMMGVLRGDGTGLYVRVGRSCVLLGGGADRSAGPFCNVTTISGGPAEPGAGRFVGEDGG